MNKLELIKAVSQEVDLNADKTGKVINAVLTHITKALQKGDKVIFVGFGTFKAIRMAARSGQNPRTGVPIQISPRNTARFKPGKILKSALNGKNSK